EDRRTGAQVVEVRGHDVEVVALGIQRRDRALRPLLAVVLVVVVGADVRYDVLAEQAHEALAQRRLAGRRVTDDAQDDWPRHIRAHGATRRKSNAIRPGDPGVNAASRAPGSACSRRRTVSSAARSARDAASTTPAGAGAAPCSRA